MKLHGRRVNTISDRAPPVELLGPMHVFFRRTGLRHHNRRTKTGYTHVRTIVNNTEMSSFTQITKNLISNSMNEDLTRQQVGQ